MTKKRAFVLLTLMNFIIYGMNGIYYSFIQQYIGVYQPPVAAGYLLALGPAVTMISPFFWGIRADKAKYKNTILLINLIGGAVSLSVLPLFPESFPYLFVVLVTLMFFIAPFATMADAITLDIASDMGLTFGMMRCVGTLAFGVMTLLVSALYERSRAWFFIVYGILAVMGVIVLLICPKAKGKADSKKRLDIRPIFRDRTLMSYTALICMSQFLWQFYLNLYPGYVTGELGMSGRAWGWNILLSVAGEIPFFLLCKAIFRRRRGRQAAVFAALMLTCVRYLVFAFASSGWVIHLNALLTGFSPVVLLYCATLYVVDNLPPELHATAINIPTALSFGGARMAASVLSGYAAVGLGAQKTLLYCFFFAAASMIAYYAVGFVRAACGRFRK